MTREQRLDYIKHTEEMIEPEQVARVNQASSFLRRLPLKLQKKIAAKGAVKNPYMGFVVEPYSFFLSYGLRDPAKAAALLPPGYRLAPASMFAGEAPRPCAILGAFNVHTSVFWGSRLELYLIAENEKTGLMSWIIAAYETNTNSFDPGQGFTAPSTSRSVVTTTFEGDVVVDVVGKSSGRRLALTANIEGKPRRPLNQRLWVEGNLSVDYGGDHEGAGGQPFGLIFDPREMADALRLDPAAVAIEENGFGAGFLESRPFEAACFPFAQHFVTTSLPMDIGLRSGSELEGAVLRFGARRTRPAPAAALNAAIIG